MKTLHLTNSDRDLFDRVTAAEYVVVAQSFEKHALWKDERNRPWVQDTSGRGLEIGTIGDRSVFVSLTWAKVSGVEVMFVEPSSELIDYKMIDDFLQLNCTGALPSNSKYIQQVNPENFYPKKPYVDPDRKHVSFDVWNTLIAGNLTFSANRLAIIAKHFNLEPVYHSTIKEAYRDVKHTLDWLAETRGEAYTCLQVYSLLASKLGITGVTDESLEQLRLAVEQEFLINPPIALPETVAALQKLRDAGYTVSIGSNSNFISGSTMYPWLQQTFGDFEFGVFSDLEQTAKPNSKFFDKIADLAYSTRKLWRSQIIHVGDHEICDVRGAKNADMHPILCNAVTDIPSIVTQILEGK